LPGVILPGFLFAGHPARAALWIWLRNRTSGRISRGQIAGLPAPSSGKRRRPTIRYFIATAYSVEGTYPGDDTVEDTGGKVDGHHIDLYMITSI
jgi:hypothetical protein